MSDRVYRETEPEPSGYVAPCGLMGEAGRRCNCSLCAAAGANTIDWQSMTPDEVKAKMNELAAVAAGLSEEELNRRLEAGADPDECSRCGGSGGGPDIPLRCPACRGTGLAPHARHLVEPDPDDDIPW